MGASDFLLIDGRPAVISMKPIVSVREDAEADPLIAIAGGGVHLRAPNRFIL